MEFIRSLIYGRRGFPPDVKRMLKLYGMERVMKLEIIRYPIDPNVNKILNVILSLNRRNIPFDKFFHLSAIINTDRGSRILIKKIMYFIWK